MRFSLFDVFFNYRQEETYIGPLWTMSVELVGSFLTLVAVLLLRSARARLFLLVVLALAIGLLPLSPTMALLMMFPLGIAIAHGFNRGWLDQMPGPGAFGAIAAGCLIAALVPMAVMPPARIASCLIVLGCIGAPQVRAFLCGAVSAWLGRLSFPLYLMHGPVMWVVGEPLMRNAGSISSSIGIDVLTVALSFLAAWLFLPVNDFALRVSRDVGQRFSGLAIVSGLGPRL